MPSAKRSVTLVPMRCRSRLDQPRAGGPLQPVAQLAIDALKERLVACIARRLPRGLKLGHLRCDLLKRCGRHEIGMGADRVLRQCSALLLRLARECAPDL